MAVEKDRSRKAIPIRWDSTNIPSDTVMIEAEFALEIGQVIPNNGHYILVFEEDFLGPSRVRVIGVMPKVDWQLIGLRDKMAADPIGIEEGEIVVR